MNLRLQKIVYIIILFLIFIGSHLFSSEIVNKNFNTKAIIEKIEFYTKEIKNEPNDFSSYEIRGDYYTKLKKYDLALKDYIKANSLTENPKSYRSIAKIELIQDNIEISLQAISKSISFQGYKSFEYGIRGLCYLFLNKNKLAIEDFTQFLEPDSKVRIDLEKKEIYSLLYILRAMLFYESNGFESALNDINVAIMVDKKFENKNSNLYYIRYLIFDALNNKVEAKKDLITALEKGFAIEKKLNFIQQKYTGEEKVEIEMLIKKYVKKLSDKEFDYENRKYIVNTFFQIED